MKTIDSTLYARIDEFENIMCNSRINRIKNLIHDLILVNFFSSTSLEKITGNYEGGLFWHSFETTKNLIRLTEELDIKWEKDDSPYILGMFYSLHKCCDLSKSIKLLEKYVDLTEEEAMCLNNNNECVNLVYLKMADIMSKTINKL